MTKKFKPIVKDSKWVNYDAYVRSLSNVCKVCLGKGFESGLDDMSDLIPFIPCCACGGSTND